ncbi:MAG TPA: fumarate reductase subunit FrdD [Bryobacteraceae bacterium]|nr:fumarate reductase subunit FrdD [Bryobacteraceae bacterium]
MSKRSNEPFLWLLFSSGGVIAAMLMPIHLLLFGLAFPLGWLEPPAFDRLRVLAGHPVTRVYLLMFCALPLFHWAHRFRFTLYDGLQIKHLNELINTFCYGGAVIGTAVAAYLISRIP